MSKLIEVTQTGGPEVLTLVERDIAAPDVGEVQIKQTAIGLNFIDVYFRTGLYPAPQMPFTPGMEGAGEIIALGDGVTSFSVGDRVAYAAAPVGAYAEVRNISAASLVKIPQGISDETAASMMLKGMTARYLLRATYKVKAGDTILFHAAAGGVGLIAGQWAKSLGVTAIGTAGSDEKCELAKQNGYDHMINYNTENFVERVKDITSGKGCEVVYDSVGKDTFPHSLDCIKPLGTWASFGQSSGPLPEVNLAILSQKGSLFATRPTLFHYIRTPELLAETANDLFNVVKVGTVKIAINQRFALEDVQGAHIAMEGRKTVGSTLLMP